ATLGKRAGKDAAQNKATLVQALGLDGARRELGRLVDEAIAAVDAAGVGAEGDVLRGAARFVAARKN
ncbi:MAG TPA: polyprenyl synthetase family protein, partial [Roseiarcus sp.]|nr:polyprenyl synthetase family protein [Roseiarcus sp.]